MDPEREGRTGDGTGGANGPVPATERDCATAVEPATAAAMVVILASALTTAQLWKRTRSRAK